MKKTIITILLTLVAVAEQYADTTPMLCKLFSFPNLTFRGVVRYIYR